jgi:nucleoside-diphosphate-sugar epimerase
MKILIIGNGFLASSIVERLEFEGHEILIFSRTQNSRIQSRQVLGDIFDYERFQEVLAWKPQVVIHTAWITTPGFYRDDLSNLKYAEFTTNLARSLHNSDIEHLIILGTCAEYGKQVGPSTAGITVPCPTTLYAQQKIVAFNSTKEILRDSPARFTWARVFYPYGPNQDQRRLIPRLISSIKNGEPIVLADTSSIYDWITTRDVALAISWVLTHNLPIEIDLGTSIGFTNLEILNALENLLQTKSLLPPEKTHSFGLSEVFVASKNSPLFTSGWSAKDSISAGLEWAIGR